MPQPSAICIVSLVIVAVLVQNASGKRGCASFGHACYGGHGKRSSSVTLPEGFDGGQQQQQQLMVESMPPLPYAKTLMAAMMDRSRNYEAPALRPGLVELLAVGRDQPPAGFAGSSSEQDRFEKSVRFAVNVILRQMLEENRSQQSPDAGEAGQSPHQSQVDSEQN